MKKHEGRYIIANIVLFSLFSGIISASAAKPETASAGGRDIVPPLVSIYTPTKDQTVSGQIVVAAQASDNVGITKVVFLVDGVAVLTDSAAPYLFDWYTRLTTDASHALTLKAYDKAGNVGVSNPMSVTVSNVANLTNQLQAELNYITNSSYTNRNINYPAMGYLQEKDDIYGAINLARVEPFITPAMASWVTPSGGAMATIGMMQALSYLYATGTDITTYDSVVDSFFLTWELAHGQGQNVDASSSDYGAFMNDVFYDADGNNATTTPYWKTDVTAQMMSANWKYYEYSINTNQIAQANDWIINAWPIEKRAADYLVRMHDQTPAGLVHMISGNSTSAEYNTWVHFAAYAVPALRSASAWAKKTNSPYADYDRVADDLVIGINSMKDYNRPNFFKFRPYLGNNNYGPPTYGDSIDQLTFSPYETGAIPVDAFAKQISDWWTYGDSQIKMTPETSNPSDWRYFGTHWHHYFNHNPENSYIFPGPGFQLAKVEWKYGKSFNDNTYTKRSNNRLVWAKGANYSSLWWYTTGQSDANVSGGFLDCRDTKNYKQTAKNWQRFVDTSGYFLETILMNEANIDTTFGPVLQ